MALQSPPPADKVKGQSGAVTDANTVYALLAQIRTALGAAIDTSTGVEYPTVAALLADAPTLQSKAELDAAIVTAETNASTYTDASVGTAVSNHNTEGATAHTGKPMMRVASSDGVFGVPGSVDIYVIPNATWALPPLTGQPNGTLIFRAAS